MSSSPSTTFALPSTSMPSARAYQERLVGKNSPGDGQAALVAVLVAVVGQRGDDRVEDVADLALDVPGEGAQGDSDLVGGQARAPVLVDVLQQVLDKGAHTGGDLRDGRARRAQNRVADNTNLTEGHARILCHPARRADVGESATKRPG